MIIQVKCVVGSGNWIMIVFYHSCIKWATFRKKTACIWGTKSWAWCRTNGQYCLLGTIRQRRFKRSEVLLKSNRILKAAFFTKTYFLNQISHVWKVSLGRVNAKVYQGFAGFARQVRNLHSGAISPNMKNRKSSSSPYFNTHLNCT